MITVDTFLESTSFEDFNDNWDLAKYTGSVIDTIEGRKIIIHILDIWSDVNSEAKKIWLDLIERAGFYPYFVDKVKKNSDYNFSVQSKIRTSFFKSEFLPNVYFHEEQKEIERAITLEKNIAVSAPTSFGKSLLIEEFVARKKFNNILIIQPTLALIDETRRKLQKYSNYYNLVVNTGQMFLEKNIFILTAERVLEYEKLPPIDFFVIDEFYKISNRRNDSRIDALNIALLKVMKNEPQAMFLTPSVDSLSENFRAKYNVEFYKTDYTLVNTKFEKIRNRNGNTLSGKRKKEKLFKLLSEQSEPSIVYVKSPNEAYKLSKLYLEYLENIDEAVILNHDLDIYEWMDENISPNWQLKKLLLHGIGTHNGALPRHIVTSEMELFNSGKLKVLFATVSLIEGVNTVAKNMIIYNKSKGKIPIDFFDFSNISGRAGRMKQHYTGNVYLFEQEPTPEKFIIDVPAIDQDKVSDEILINIPDSDVNVNGKERKDNLNSGLDPDLINIIKKNLISIKGQKDLYEYICTNIKQLDYLKWNNIPTYDQLWRTLDLCYTFLKSGKLSDHFAQGRALMALKLVKYPLFKVILEQTEYYRKKSKKYLDPENTAIDFVLKFQRNDASFEIPKLLAVIESLQKYYFDHNNVEGNVDYSTFSSMLENEQTDEKFQFLIDYGVPSSAIKKISQIDNPESNVQNASSIITFIKHNSKRIYAKLLPYEQRLLNNAIES